MSLLFTKWRTGHSTFGQQNASIAQESMSGGSGFLPVLSLNNRQHLIQPTPSLPHHLTLWTVCGKLIHMGTSRIWVKDSAWPKFSPAPQHKVLPQVTPNARSYDHRKLCYVLRRPRNRGSNASVIPTEIWPVLQHLVAVTLQSFWAVRLALFSVK